MHVHDLMSTRLLTTRVLPALVLFLLTTGSVQGQDYTCSIAAAEEAYELGFFSTMVEQLNDPCSFPESESEVRRLRLLALAHLALDEETQARQSVRRLMRLDPSYRPDADQDPLRFRQFVDHFKPRWYQRRWVQVAGGAGLAAAAGWLGFTLLKSEPDQLPLPPGFPPEN